MVNLPGRKLHSQELVFILYLGRVNTVPLQPSMQLEIFWVTPRTPPGDLLSSISSLLILLLLQYTLPLSLSLSQSLRIVTLMLKEPATGYSKITTD